MVNPSVPSPRTWSPGDLVTVPRLRADLADAVALLAQRPYLVGQGTTGQPFASAEDIVILMDSELTDAWGGHISGSADYWAPAPGWYLCDARAPFAYTSSTPAPVMAGWSGTNNGLGIPITHGAITANGSTSGNVAARAVDLIPQTLSGPPGAGDLIQAFARQDSSGTVSLGTAGFDLPTVSIRWVCSLTGTQPLPVPPLTPAPTPITSAWLNANLRDAVRFLTYPPVLKAHTTSGSVANSTLTSPVNVSPATVDVDNYGAYSAGVYTAPVAGRYLIAGQVNYASSSTTATYGCGIKVNGSLLLGSAVRFAGSSLAGGADVVKRVRLSAGDTVQLAAAQTTGSTLNLNTSTGNQTRLIAVWEGA